MVSILNKIVVVPDDPRLFAKVLKRDAASAEVEFFSSAAKRQFLTVPNGKFAHTELPAQPPVFVQSELGNWRVGRVKGRLQALDGGFVYELRLPNSKEIDVHEDKVFVRCLDAFADPAEILAARCPETQFYADRRRLALRRLRDLRSAAQGITGLISANVELIPYQAAAAKRVLQDQSLRYLLADEVGLGKTIEAGVIIRQVLIDDPRRRVTVLVPDPIVQQWRSELDRAFSLADFPNSVRVAPHEVARTINLETPPDLLVIDEAHHSEMGRRHLQMGSAETTFALFSKASVRISWTSSWRSSALNIPGKSGKF
jgi:ATP-dependent helicase HepA